MVAHTTLLEISCCGSLIMNTKKMNNTVNSQMVHLSHRDGSLKYPHKNLDFELSRMDYASVLVKIKMYNVMLVDKPTPLSMTRTYVI